MNIGSDQTMTHEPLALDKGFRIIQIHPTLQCNLTCIHCYSSSSPKLKQELPIESLKVFLQQAYAQGFNAIAVSGGEPFLYSHLHELLHYSKSLGYYNSVTTNGTLFNHRTDHRKTLELIDLLAISLDGEPAHHNYLRNSPKAFDKMLEGLEIVKDSMEAYGFIHTVTPDTLASLFWLGDFVANHGGKLLQLHPLESFGRGKDVYDDLALNQTLLQKIFILIQYLKHKYANQFVIELDLLHRDQILQNPQSIYAHLPATAPGVLTQRLREIIVDERGDIIPVSHGFSKFHKIGNILESADFKSLSADFMMGKYDSLQRLFNNTFNAIEANENIELLNWAELVVQNSHHQHFEEMLAAV